MPNEEWEEIQPHAEYIRVHIIKSTKSEFSNNKSFQKVLNKQITPSLLTLIEDNLANRGLIKEYCLALKDFIGADYSDFKCTKQEIEKMENINKDDDNSDQVILEKLKKRWFSKNIPIDRKIYNLHSYFISINKFLKEEEIIYIPLIRSSYEYQFHNSKHSKEIFMKIVTDIRELSMRKASFQQSKDFPFEYYQKASETLLRLISSLPYCGEKIYLASTDLSFLDLSCPENDTRSLANAQFNYCRFQQTNFTGLILDNVNFDLVSDFQFACFKNTSLRGATFKKADLTRVNRKRPGRNRLPQESQFLENMDLDEAGKPFLDAEPLETRKMDKWLKDYIMRNNA
jgi:uncharacterized protein YjbI with pentapeptide repeats